MLKIITHTLILLLVIAFIGFGIYLIVENNNISFSGQAELNHGRPNGEAFTNPSDGSLPEGQPPAEGSFPRGEGRREGSEMGGSSHGWIEFAAQTGKIALITVAVGFIQWMIKSIKRRKRADKPLPQTS